MASRIRFFNRWGEYEDMIEDVPTTPRSWVLNGYGRCEFSIPLDSEYVKERFLQFGNLIHVEHVRKVGLDESSPTGKLPDWTGVILPPRNWSDDVVHVVAYSAEAILAYRAMPFIDVQGTPRTVMQTLVNYVNRNYPPAGLRLAFPEDLAITFQDKLRTNAYDHIRKLADFCGMDWGVQGVIVPDSNALILTAYMQFKQTQPNSLVLNEENTKTVGDILTEQGTIFNRIYAYTQASTPQDREFTKIEYQQSIDTFGPFEINKVYTGVTDPAILADAAALKTASGSGFPQRVFKRVALDRDQNWDLIRPGNVISINESRAGFNRAGGLGFGALVRVLSMDYNDNIDEELNLNVEIITRQVSLQQQSKPDYYTGSL